MPKETSHLENGLTPLTGHVIKSHGLSVLHDAVASLPMIDTSGTLSEQLREFGDSSVKISTMQDAIGLYKYFKVVEVAEVAVRMIQFIFFVAFICLCPKSRFVSGSGALMFGPAVKRFDDFDVRCHGVFELF